MSVKFPALKSWQIDADQTSFIGFFPETSKVSLIFKNFKFDFDTDLKLDENGYLDPVVKACSVRFGESYLYHDNPITALVMH